SGYDTGTVALEANASGEILNTGTISGWIGIKNEVNGLATTINTGKLIGTSYAYDGGLNTTDNFYNDGGVIIGNISLGLGSGGFLVNRGTIQGDIQIGFSNIQSADSTFGSVYGGISTGAGGGIVTGGQNGGSILGSSGNDVFYANPTQTAAD